MILIAIKTINTELFTYSCNIRFEFISLKLQLCIAEVLYLLSCRVIQCAILIVTRDGR